MGNNISDIVNNAADAIINSSELDTTGKNDLAAIIYTAANKIIEAGGGGGGGAVTGVKGSAESTYRTGNVDISASNIGLGNVDNTSDLNKPISTATQTALNGKVNTSSVGSANGVAELDANGRVPSSQLPSYVDDTVEGYLNSVDGKFYADSSYTTEITGETGKIYVTLDTNKTYRWSGSGFVEISESLALGETSSTAYAGNKGKANADAIAAIKDGTNIDSFGDVETALAGKANSSDLGDKSNLTTTDKSSCVGAINELNNAIVVSRVTASSAFEVPTTNITQFTIPATKSGYKPIGIVGWGASSGNSNIFIVEVHIDGSGNVNGYLRNVGSSQASVSGLRFDVLYAKDV